MCLVSVLTSSLTLHPVAKRARMRQYPYIYVVLPVANDQGYYMYATIQIINIIEVAISIMIIEVSNITLLNALVWRIYCLEEFEANYLENDLDLLLGPAYWKKICLLRKIY